MSNTASELRRLIAEAQQELARLESLPVEPLSDLDDSHPLGNPVVRFRIRFRDHLRVYTYIAVRTGSRWHLSGSSQAGGPLSWPELWQWIEKRGELVGPMEVATGWQPVR